MIKTAFFFICLLKAIMAKHVYLASNTTSTKITNTSHSINQLEQQDLNYWYWGWYNIYWLRHRKTLPAHQIAYDDGVRILFESTETRNAPENPPYYYYMNYEATFESIDINPTEATLFLGCMDDCTVYFNDELIREGCCYLNTTNLTIQPGITNNLTILNMEHREHYAGVIFYIYRFEQNEGNEEEVVARIAIPTVLILIVFIAVNKYLKKKMIQKQIELREAKESQRFDTVETLVRESPAPLKLG